MVNNGYVYQFAFQYTDKNRTKLKTIKGWQNMDKYLNSQNLLDDFVAFATLKGITPNPKQIAISKNFILIQLKAYITRNIQGEEGFFPLLYKDDKTVLKALEVLKSKK